MLLCAFKWNWRGIFFYQVWSRNRLSLWGGWPGRNSLSSTEEPQTPNAQVRRTCINITHVFVCLYALCTSTRAATTHAHKMLCKQREKKCPVILPPSRAFISPCDTWLARFKFVEEALQMNLERMALKLDPYEYFHGRAPNVNIV